MHNRAWFSADLVMARTLARLARLNVFDVRAFASHTQDIDLAKQQARNWRRRPRQVAVMALPVKRDNVVLVATAAALPQMVLAAARQGLPTLRGLLALHPRALDEVTLMLTTSARLSRPR